MRIIAIPACAVSLCLSASFAQTIARKEPAQYTGPVRASRVEARPPGIRLSLRKPREFALAPLSASEYARMAGPGTRLRTGVHRQLPVEALSLGNWEVTPEGKRIWRMALRSPESAGIRLEFRNFSVGEGQLWLHDGAQTAGPYTGRGMYDDGHFWSATVFSESIMVEYEPGPDSTETASLPFEINAVSHQATRASLRGGLQAGAKDPADACHLDPNCYGDWQPAMSMVAQLAYEENGVRYFCSGSLVGTRDNSFIPYLLTAGHCIHSEAAARTLEVYWSYQTASCGGTPPASRIDSAKSTLGAHLIDFGTIEEGDFSLVRLRDVPSGVTFAGWDMSDPAFSSNLVGLHHPAGSWKRISFGGRIGDKTVVVEDSTAPGNRYLSVLWDKGRTEPGSSGSALFSSPGVIVGVLSYGPFSPVATACEISPSIDGYGRFTNVYDRLRDYFENLPAAIVAPDKGALSFSITNRAAPANQTVRLTTQAKGDVTYKLRADAPWIQLSSMTGASSESVPGQVNISINSSLFDRPGKYSGTVTILSAAAPPQFINVSTTVVITQSNVQPSISPNPVTESGGVRSFTIRLEETAGGGTRLTAIKLNGTDYSGNIKAWFGTDHIDANGVIEAPLQAAGRFPAGPQYFEFSGVDDGSGQRWYRVATVNFE